MTRTYELVFIVEPRRSDDDVQALTEKYTGMIEASGATIKYIDHWGKRKLAYPIQNFNEGKYVVVYVTADDEALDFDALGPPAGPSYWGADAPNSGADTTAARSA